MLEALFKYVYGRHVRRIYVRKGENSPTLTSPPFRGALRNLEHFVIFDAGNKFKCGYGKHKRQERNAE